MPVAGEPTESPEHWQRLQEILLADLETSGGPLWPGADGLTVQDALHGYAEAAANGLVSDLPELLQRHPELADDLKAFFASLGPTRKQAPRHSWTSLCPVPFAGSQPAHYPASGTGPERQRLPCAGCQERDHEIADLRAELARLRQQVAELQRQRK